MSRSEVGVGEIHLVSMQAVDEFITGQSLPPAANRLAAAIASNKEMGFTPYDPPKDMFNSVIHQNSKKNIRLLLTTLQSDWTVLDIARYLHYQGGTDAVVVRDGYLEYEGNSSGVPTVGGGIYWLKNPTEGIFVFSKNNNTHLGIDWEFKMTDKTQEIMLTCEAAINALAAKQIPLVAQTNIVRKSAVQVPEINSAKQVVYELKEVQKHNGTSWETFMPYDDIDSHELTFKSVENKKLKDNRSKKGLGEVSINIVGADARCAKIYEYWNTDQFARLRLVFIHPITGLEYYFEIADKTVTNLVTPFFNGQRADNTLSIAGQFSLAKVFWDAWTSRTIRIGSALS